MLFIIIIRKNKIIKKANNSDKNIIKITNKEENIQNIQNVQNPNKSKRRKSRAFNMKEELIKNEKMKKQLSKEILKELNDIKIDLIEISIDNTQKFLKDKINNIVKNSNNLGKKKKKNDSRKENYDELNLGQFPDLNVEKRDKERKVKRTTQRLRKKRMTTKMLNIEQEEEQFNKNKGDLSKLNLLYMTKIIHFIIINYLL